MLRLVLAYVRARRQRAPLSALAVMFGVTLIAGTLIFTDTIHSAFSQALAESARGADAIVSGRTQHPASAQVQPPSVPDTVLAKIRALPDVALAEGQVSDTAALVGGDGKLVSVDGGHAQAVSYLGPPFQAVEISRGRPPRADGEVAIDAYTASAAHYRLGQQVAIATAVPAQIFTITGFTRFRGSGLVVFSLPTAKRLFLEPTTTDQVAVAGLPGVPPAKLAREIRPLLGPELVVRTAAAQAAQNTSDVSSRLAPLMRALLAFGLIAALVGSFVIFNAFSITVAQRTRELALLRTLGASRRQLLATVIGEALVIGAAASAAAVALGLAVAVVIRALFNAFGRGLPQASPVLSARTVGACLAVGIGVTVLAALPPALRATRVPPVAAMRDGVGPPPSRLGRALPWLALLLGAAGLAATLDSLISGGGVALSASGAAALVVAGALASPRLVPIAARAAGWPLERTTAVAGRLARENAARNPARTAATAASLMVGLALVLFVTILAGEARDQIRGVVARSFAGDFAITGQTDSAQIPKGVVTAVAAVPGVQVASALKRSRATVEGAGTQSVNAIDTQTLAGVYRFDWITGDDSLLGFLGPNGALVERDLARRANLHLDEHFTATTPAGTAIDLTVRGVYRDNALLPGVTLNFPAYDDLFHQQRVRRVLIKLAPGADPPSVQRQINEALAPWPEARARSQQQLKDEEASRLDAVLYLFYALLAVSVVVSLCGLAGTLTLEIHERTRELGTLRALGLSRKGVRRIVRYESAITAALGAVLGLALGIFLAAIVTTALADRGFVFTVPWAQVAGLLALMLVLGIVAAVIPAHRASRLDVLTAIAYE